MKTKEVIKEIFKNIKSSWYMPVVEKQVYSEQETVVGVWTDGKPLYKRTFGGTAGARSAWVKIADLGTNCTIVRGEAYIILSDGLTIPAGYSTGATFDVLYNRDESGIRLGAASICHNSNDWIGLPVIIIIEYTKTTDTPVSQPKVPFEPLTEYSTEQKMIGWWIDGKPLYRMVVDGLNITTKNSWYWADVITVPDIGKLISCRVFHGGVLTEAVEAKIENSVVQVAVPYGRTLTGVIVEYTKITG